MKVKCPKCGKETSFEDNPFRPFCSERCKLVDLGKWLSGSYSVPTEKEEEEDKRSKVDEKSEDP
jgi:endogenous inhibitor of DNA gyrase (YacG/DUF329 family)